VGLRRCQAFLLLAPVAIVLVIPVSAGEGAVPKRGSWSGATSQDRPVMFGVSGRVRRSVKRLEIGTAGPPPSGVKMSCSSDPNDFIDSRFRTSDSIKVNRDGHFEDTFQTQGNITQGTLRISGTFKTKTKVKGRLRWRVTRSDTGGTCDSGRLTFAASKPQGYSSSGRARR
jgi:hypothetical protein